MAAFMLQQNWILGQETTWPKKPNTFPIWPFTEKIYKPTIVSKFLFYLPPGTSQKDKNFNLPRLCIRKFFPKKKCLIFDRPTHRKKLGQLETLHDDELDPKFLQQAAAFCSYIYNNSQTKTLSGGIKVNGPRESPSLSLSSLLRLKEGGKTST